MRKLILLLLLIGVGCQGDVCETSSECPLGQFCVESGGVLFGGKECVPSSGLGIDYGDFAVSDNGLADFGVVDHGLPDLGVTDANLPDQEHDLNPMDQGDDLINDLDPNECVSGSDPARCEPGCGTNITDPTCSPCPTGTFSAATDATSCAAWTTCLAGEEIATAGTNTTDRTCSACPAGSYSDSLNAVVCDTWTECGVDEYVLVEGTVSMDRQCATLMDAGASCNGAAECASGECQRGYCKLTDWSVIPAGFYTQGSPTSEIGRNLDETQRVVSITRPFFLKETEVSRAEWMALMGNLPANSSSGSPDTPVRRVNWWDAVAYANALSLSEGLDPCYVVSECSESPGEVGYSCEAVTFEGLDCEGYRLPTEAEWEYAARAGTTTMTYAGDHSATGLQAGCVPDAVLSSIAWWCENSFSAARAVGQKPANAWGLHDMIGNVWEWTQDWFGSYSPGNVTDPIGPIGGSNRVRRGCSVSNPASTCRAAFRQSTEPASRFNDLGFRPARTIP